MRDLRKSARAAASSGRLCIVLAGALAIAQPVRAQTADTVADSTPRIVAGRVVRPGGRDVVPVAGVWVTLHRVGSDTAGPIDSMRTARNGAYVFRYRHTGRADAVYFVSARYDGIAYFSPPLTAPRVTGDSAEVTVFDTTSRPTALHVRGRHLIVSAPRVDGSRDVVEVYEIANDTSVTFISADDAHPTWTAILPANASGFQVGQGEISPSSIHATDGRVVIVAPFAPGLKTLSFTYRLPAAAFPLNVPLERDVTVLEVLVEGTGAKVSGARLAAVAPVGIQGRTFERFLAHDVPANAVMTIAVPTVRPALGGTRYLIALAVAIGTAMLAALTFTFVRHRRAHTVVAPHAPDEDDAARLARTIAQLDIEFEQRRDASLAERAAYEAQRADLKRQLARALDARRSRT